MNCLYKNDCIEFIVVTATTANGWYLRAIWSTNSLDRCRIFCLDAELVMRPDQKARNVYWKQRPWRASQDMCQKWVKEFHYIKLVHALSWKKTNEWVLWYRAQPFQLNGCYFYKLYRENCWGIFSFLLPWKGKVCYHLPTSKLTMTKWFTQVFSKRYRYNMPSKTPELVPNQLPYMKGHTFRSLANAHDFKPSLLCSSAKRSNSSTSLCGLRIGSSLPNSKPLQVTDSNHWTNLLYILLQLVHLIEHSLIVLRRRSASERICCWNKNRC